MDAGVPLKLRSDEDIVADIVKRLKPLKPGSGDLLALTFAAANEFTDVIGQYPGPIYATIQLARLEFPGSVTRAHTIKASVKYLKKVRAKLGEDCPPKVAFAIHQYVTEINALSERYDPFVDFCARHAVKLVKQFSTNPPVITPFGNVHGIAQSIYEAATGKPPAGTGLLKACQKLLSRTKVIT